MKIEELTEKMNDAEQVLMQQGKRIKDLENKGVKMPDYTAEIIKIQEELKNLSSKLNLGQFKEMIDKLQKLLEKQTTQVKRQYRFLLFPDTNQGRYYKIVFGRLIPWTFVFIVATYLFVLAKDVINGWGNFRYNQQSEQCVRAWLYLNDQAGRQVKKEMDRAWVKSSETKYK